MAGGGHETPRQRMINMMYIVLIALLALNVSSEVLNAFKTVRTSLESTMKNTHSTVQTVMQSFEGSMAKDPVKTQPYYDKAKTAISKVDSFNNYIEGIKKELIDAAHGYDEDTKDIKDRDDTDSPSRILLEPDKTGKTRGAEIKNKLNNLRKDLLSLVDPTDVNQIGLPLQEIKDEGHEDPWEVRRFESVPVTAAVTLLTQLQADAKNSELAIAHYQLSAIGSTDFKFDKLSPNIVAKSTYVTLGTEYQADIYLTAYSSTMPMKVYVGGKEIPVKDGKATYTVTPNQQGLVNWSGKITVEGNKGSQTEYPFQGSYQVAASSAVISPTAMNVLYVGVDNPIAISAAGLPPDKIFASISQGSITGQKGKYTARVSRQGDAVIKVSTRNDSGVLQTVGSMKFRVKLVPPPIAKFAGASSGKIRASIARVQQGVFAVLENFEFENVKFSITGFNMYITRKGRDPFAGVSTGSSLTPEMKNALANLAPGDRIIIEDIKAKGPDGVTRKLPSGISVAIQ